MEIVYEHKEKHLSTSTPNKIPTTKIKNKEPFAQHRKTK